MKAAGGSQRLRLSARGVLPGLPKRHVGFVQVASRTCRRSWSDLEPSAGSAAPGTAGARSAVNVSRRAASRSAKRLAELGRLGLMEAGVAIAVLILLGAVGAALAAERARKKDTPAVGDPYEALYPGRHEKRAPLRRDGSGLRPGEGAGLAAPPATLRRMKAALHGGPCDGRVDNNLREPPQLYTCRKEVMPPDWERPVPPNKPTPEVTYEEHQYRCVRVEGDVAHYQHAPDLY
jgi:hypothetical protein